MNASQPVAEVEVDQGRLPGHSRAVWAVRDLQTRFLHVFTFDREKFAKLEEALKAELPREGSKPRIPLWHGHGQEKPLVEPSHLYRDELLDHVASVVFPEGKTKGSGYFRIEPSLANRWFQGVELQTSHREPIPVALVSGPSIELFLLPQGIGVLSITLKPHGDGPLDLSRMLEFNYRIAQFSRHSLSRFRKRHPSDDAEAFARMPVETRSGIPAPPADSVELSQRLGAPGGSFALTELFDWLLAPLKQLDAPSIETSRGELLVYTVARLGTEVDFGDRAVVEGLGPLLSALTQVEESGHSGSAPGVLSLSNRVNNTKHWYAVGLLGAAHLIADQPGDVAFNDQKLPIVRDKYFIPYLLSVLQRFTLNRAIDEAGQIVLGPAKGASSRLKRLRRRLLEFGVGGHFMQVSTRQALHDFYQVAREGLDVPKAWAEIRHAIADLDTQASARRQRRLEREVAGNIDAIKKVQEFVHLIEYCLVSVYFAHLWHMAAEGNEELTKDLGRILHVNRHWVVSIGVVFFAIAGFIIVAILNRYLRSHSGEKH